jgi:hypothetical protein
MQDLNLFKIYTDILNQNKFRYFITGSVAAIVYGDPRLTHDIDLVINLNTGEIEKFIQAFPEQQFYCPPVDVIRTELHRSSRGHFNLIHHETGFKADIYLVGEEELQSWAMENSKEIEFEGSIIFIAPPEYVIIKKLEFYQEGKAQKHIADINSILANSKQLIDFGFLNKAIDEKSLSECWNEVINDA